MRHSLGVLLGLGLALSAAGCSDYLSAPNLTSDPTKPSVIPVPKPLYVGIEEAGPPQREGQLARFAVEFTQQIAGNSRQQIGYDLYQVRPADTDPYFAAVYGSNNTLNGGGGLLDIHKMIQIARKRGDSLYIGIGKVYEAMYIGLAADQFGDIPYREAADSTNLHPKFDPQLQVYGDLQQQLDSAITIFLAASGPSNGGPAADGAELIYRNRSPDDLRAVYTAVAHSLKARLYMHTAEVDPGAYALALAQVPLGISTPDDDFLWFHDGTPSGQNIWWQWGSARGDNGPGAALIEILKRRIAAGVEDNKRLAFYFTTADGAAPSPTGANFFGFRPGGTPAVPSSGPDPGSGDATGSYSGFGAFIDGTSAPGDFRQPEITYAETQLIGAEAALHAGDVPTAQTYLNNARTNRHYGATAGSPVTFGDAPGVLTATLQNIIEEKYSTLFLNPEVWNDYKRTCFPSLAPAPGAIDAGTAPRTTPIPSRLPYGQSELNANGANAPNVTASSQNPNDPNPCPVLNYQSSSPLAN